MDAAKVMAALAPGSAKLTDFFGVDKIKIQPLPIVAVPLTAGSGSEVTPLAAITTENDFPEIEIVASSLIYPTLAFVDPIFTLAFPEAVTVANGLDALSHSVEGIISKNSQPLTDLLALESIKLVTRYLPEVLSDPKNMSYRSKLSYAALLAGVVVGQTGMGLAHHMGFYLTLDLGLKHGMANGLLLPSTCKVSLSREHIKMEAIAKAFGADISKLSGNEAIEAVVGHIRTFTTQFDLISALNEKSRLGEKIKNYSDMLLKNADPLLINTLDLKKEEIEDIYRKSLM
jgi:alcohol dehydrogenase class IV